MKVVIRKNPVRKVVLHKDTVWDQTMKNSPRKLRIANNNTRHTTQRSYTSELHDWDLTDGVDHAGLSAEGLLRGGVVEHVERHHPLA